MSVLKFREQKFDGDIFDVISQIKNREYLAVLDSSLYHQEYGRYSIIAWDPIELIEGQGMDSFKGLQKVYQKYQKKFKSQKRSLPFQGGLIGSIGYDWEVCFGVYDKFAVIDHWKRKIIWTDPQLSFPRRAAACLPVGRESSEFLDPRVKPEDDKIKLKSNITKKQYLKKVKQAQDYIAQGEIYQANLSQKFSAQGDFLEQDWFQIYQDLRRESPSHFSGYFQSKDFALISSSPERFLKSDGKMITSVPMKGTRKRGSSKQEDKRLKNELLKSEKDKAELLMITDLMRNDLGRVCEYGSIKVKNQRRVEEYSTVFQTTSTIQGKLRKDVTSFDVLKATFPGGSITGCPKIRSMEIIDELEPTSRSFYTGSLGCISFDGKMDFNILIRTMIAKQDEISFQVGGGIVADSDPEKEYEETLVKAKAMVDVLQNGKRRSLSEVEASDVRQKKSPSTSFREQLATVFLNGKFFDVDDFWLKKHSPGVLKAQGMFETMKIVSDQIEHFDLHMDRLNRGLNLIGLKMPLSQKTIQKKSFELMKKNELQEARLRIMVFNRHCEEQSDAAIQDSRLLRFARNDISVFISAFPFSKPKKKWTAMISSVRRPQSRTSHVKSLDWHCYRQAWDEAIENNVDEAILLNSKGHLVEGSRTNLFWEKDGVLFTPAVVAGCLNGIIRQKVIQKAKANAQTVRCVHAKPSALKSADKIFLTNSVFGKIPVKIRG